MAFTGKLFGALIGSLAGPMGAILGGVVGHLFDRAVEERKAYNIFPGTSPSLYSDSVSAAQVNFLTSLIGLSIAVANADGHVRVSQVEVIKSFFRSQFPFTHDDQRLVQRIIAESYKNREEIDINALCRYYRGVSNFEGRLLLLWLLFKIADADSQGVIRVEEEMIRRIAGLLGAGAAEFMSIRAEFIRNESRAYEIFGLEPAASDEEVRAAYRRLAAQNHPDRVANLGEEFVKVAEEKFKTINAAYEEIRKEREF
ncbi:Co-chaperone protein DjlA [subsurface metagenome]